MDNSEFFRPQDENEFYVSQNVKQAFDENGYILVRNLITAEEIKTLKNYAETNADIHSRLKMEKNSTMKNLCTYSSVPNKCPGQISVLDRTLP